MKNYFLALGVLFLSFNPVNAQEIQTVKYEELNDIFHQDQDKLTVVNFWATWCGPCVKEIPYFVEASEQYKNEVNFIYVSLDRAKLLDKVEGFVTKNNMTGNLLLLDDSKRMNEWIPMIEPNWQGNIPATVFYKNGEKVFFHGEEISKEDLIQKIEEFK